MRHSLPTLATLACLGLLTGCPADHTGDTVAAAQAVPIGAVQGEGERSPLEGRQVTVEGVVTGNFGRNLGGWFLQDQGDDNPATSDAVFVLAGPESGVGSGQRVRVHGTVVEHGDGDATLTAIEPVQVEVLGRNGTVPALELDAPPEDWEPLEGMRVRITAPLTISGQHDLARRGVLVASFDGRLAVPTEVAAPGADANAVAQANQRRRVLIDDARAAENPRSIWYLPDDGQSPRAGSVLEGIEGIVDQRWGSYRLQLTEKPALQPAPRPPAPTVPGDLRVAVLNVENLFNGDGRGGGFPTERGARSPEELERQIARLHATISALDPDALALMELENDGYGADSSIAQLAATLGPQWRYVDAGRGPGSDVIRVGLMYRSDRLRTTGRPATLEGGPFGSRSRAPLAQAFVPLADGADDGPAFVLVANHFKSKGCGEATGENADQGDGQSCWNALRRDSALRLARWLDGDPTGTGSELTAIVGDLNAYFMEDPVQALRQAGWRHAFADAPDTAALQDGHSYVYDGQAGSLDHALLSPALAARLAGAAIWQTNADEAASLGYRSGDGDGGPWRSSDHDPLLLGFRLRAR